MPKLPFINAQYQEHSLTRKVNTVNDLAPRTARTPSPDLACNPHPKDVLHFARIPPPTNCSQSMRF